MQTEICGVPYLGFCKHGSMNRECIVLVVSSHITKKKKDISVAYFHHFFHNSIQMHHGVVTVNNLHQFMMNLVKNTRTVKM